MKTIYEKFIEEDLVLDLFDLPEKIERKITNLDG